MRCKFNPNAVASSTGDYTRVSHDRKANTTGRTNYSFCGKEVIITDNRVYAKSTGLCMGMLHVDDDGNKYVHGPNYKGMLNHI